MTQESQSTENSAMKHTTVAIALAAALALPQAVLVQAAETPAATPQTQTQAVKGYLGVSIDRLPEALRAQLADSVPPQQGVLVTQVMQGSPAEKAGIEPFDILLRYDDQELFSPEQLTKLVGSDTSGKPVKLTIVRAGNVSTLDVTLGENQAQESAPWFAQPELRPLPLPRYHRPPFPGPQQQAPQSSEKNWQSFDALSLDKLKGDQYKAVIGYLAKDGSHERLEFKGTRDEIRQKILAQKDLPDRERGQLLDALTSRDDFFPPHAWAFAPFEQDFPQPPPWWGWHPDF
jgi:hypothetical protein